MKQGPILILNCLCFFSLLMADFSSGQTGEAWHTPPDQWTEPRLYHSAFEKEYEKRILISRISKMDAAEEMVFSPNKAYWYSYERPDFKKPGPWSTTFHVFNERNDLIGIQLVDHSQYEPAARWINEKLLYIQVWWGRVLGSYLIFDVEKERVVIKEMIHDGQIPFQQHKESEGTKESNPHSKK